MATIDPNIALGVKPLQLDNPMNAMAQMSQIQNYQRQNELANRAIEQEDALNRAYAASINKDTGEIDANMLRQNMATGGIASKLPAAEKSIMEGRELKAKVTKGEFENKKAQYENSINDILRFDTHDQILGSLQAKVEAKELTQQQAQQLAATVPQDPRMIPSWQIKTARGLLSAKDQLEQHFVTQDTGGGARVLGMSKYGGGPAQVVQGSQVTKTTSPDAAARLAAETATGELSPQTIDFVAETYRQTGQLPPLGMGKAAVNMRQKVLERAAQLSMAPGKDGAPGATAAEAATAVKTAKADTAAQAGAVKDFSSGMSARKVTANNTAINHLATMEKLADDLANNDTRVFNAAANAIGKQFGTTAPTNFDAARQLVASEVIKAVVANGGGVTERQEAQEQFARANSPAQLKGVINTYRELLGGQLSSLGQQYETGTGRKDFNKKLSPETAKILEKATPQTGGLSAAEQAELDQLRARFKK